MDIPRTVKLIKKYYLQVLLKTANTLQISLVSGFYETDRFEHYFEERKLFDCL